jgi:hypothetical protein
MSDHKNARPVYARPRIEAYGTLREITAQLEHALPAGMGVAGVSSAPTGGPPPGTPERTPPGPPGPEGGVLGGETGGGSPGGGQGESGVGGAELGGGGGGGAGGGGTVSGTGGNAALPFTGFPAAVAAAVGAGMATAGTALRRVLRRR